jgi:RNA polymerase sigma-70 factor (ECF subfamily)
MLKLSDSHRRLVEERYKPGASVQKIAADQGRTVGAVSQTLYRIRHNLMLCVEKTLTALQAS